MKKVILKETSAVVSRFIYGTASLFNVGERSKRLRVLDAAYDVGISHFDTAPYYGFGAAERDLQPLLARRPDVTITTKVGIYSPGGEQQSDFTIFLRKALGRIVPPVSRPTVDWSLARARKALEGSLHRLGRGRIDIYMLHEPDTGLLDTDEWSRWLEEEVARGRVGAFGIAGETGLLKGFFERGSVPLSRLVQTLDSLDKREADLLVEHGRPLQITYGYVSAAQRRRGPVDVSSVLTEALRRNRDGAVIVSTRRLDRMAQYANLANSA